MTDPTMQFDKRCETGIEGLNEILGEGLPANCLYLVQGDPGSGKTTLALQFLLEGVLLFLLLQLYARKKPATGAISGAFLLFYGDMRFLVEFTREPDSFLGLLHFGWSMGQWLSVPMMLGGAWLWWHALRPKYHWQRNSQPRQAR